MTPPTTTAGSKQGQQNSSGPEGDGVGKEVLTAGRVGSGSWSPGTHSPRSEDRRQRWNRGPLLEGILLGTVLCISPLHKWLHPRGLLKVIHWKRKRLVAAPSPPFVSALPHHPCFISPITRTAMANICWALTRHQAQRCCTEWLYLIDSSQQLTREALLAPFYRWRKRGSGRLTSPKTQSSVWT